VDSWKSQRRSAYTAIMRPRAAWAIPALASAALLGVAALTPAPLILPVVSLACLALAAGAALSAWRTGASRSSATVTCWDIAGALAFIGFAAAMLSKPENVFYAFADATVG
jgi:predicted benzoate:H+ symporter BenE